MVSARTFHNDPGIAIQRSQVTGKLIQVLGCMGNIKGFTDDSAAGLQDCYGTLSL